MVDIRKAKRKDAFGVQYCCNKAFEAYISLIDKKPAPMVYDFFKVITDNIVFVALYGAEIVGTAVVKDGKDDYMWLDVLAVNPDFSGKGIGRALISHCENYISKYGKNECRLYTNVKFQRTCNIYLRLGYEIYDEICEDGYQRYYMKKYLI